MKLELSQMSDTNGTSGRAELHSFVNPLLSLTVTDGIASRPRCADLFGARLQTPGIWRGRDL